MLHMYRMNHLNNGWKDSEGPRANHAPWSRCGPLRATRGEPRASGGLEGPGHPGREEHHLRAPDPDSGQGWRVPKIHEARHGKATEEKPTVNHR